MNSILITVDALRADHLRQYGYDRDTMPVLDRLLQQGTVFENTFANGPYTRISIPALHSSVRLAHNNLSSLPTISSELSSNKIHTACIGTRVGFKSSEGDLHFDTYVTLGRDSYYRESNNESSESIVSYIDNALRNYDRTHGFLKRVYNSITVSNNSSSDSFGYKGYTSARDVTDTANDWISKHTEEEFFLWLHYMEGHRPYGVHNDDPKYAKKVSDDRIRRLMKRAGTAAESMSIADHKLAVNLYDSDLRYCSNHIERLFDSLRDIGLWEKTNIVFTADHGEEFYDHGEYFHRNLPYDELIRVPLIVRRVSDSHMRITEPRELIDVAPTILNFHNINSPEEFDGIDLFLDGKRHLIATGSQQEDTPVVAKREGQFKYIYSPDKEYLFNMADDRPEEINLLNECGERAQSIRQSIPDRYFSERTQERLREPENEVDKQRLRALGYLELED